MDGQPTSLLDHVQPCSITCSSQSLCFFRSGRAKVEGVAVNLGISKRSLQRKLSAEVSAYAQF